MNITTQFLSLKPVQYDNIAGLLKPLVESDDPTVAFFANEVITALGNGEFVTNASWDAFKKDVETGLAILEREEMEDETLVGYVDGKLVPCEDNYFRQ